MNELTFENKLIEYLSTGRVVDDATVGEGLLDFLPKKRLWDYRADIRTTEDLWQNFKGILEKHNQSALQYRPMSVTEFAQVKRIISDLYTPYQAGQFLYGHNGTSQIEIDLDDGTHVFLTVFKQDAVGADDTVYQVVNQIERPAIITGKKARRFDTTLLINGLPMIQIEEKKDTNDVSEALNQMKEYADEGQYGDIFSTLQILVAITPNNVKYMANTPADRFNTDFAFNWQIKKEDGSGYRTVRKWKEFADQFLSIPMAHQMASSYMILDGTKNKEMLKVMRPYQVAATKLVIEKLKRTDFEFGDNRLGYIWHTTGSGKTITSFKTAWLASRLPNVHKVVFLVDRIALTNQTRDEYQAYDPEHSELSLGTVEDTKNTTTLGRRLKDKSNSIIVTSIQKMDALVKRKSFKAPEKNIVFIVDEAHRSTNGDSFVAIQKAFPSAAWVGYTGTPMVDGTTRGTRTEDVFGPLLHSYTIRDAIRDGNVLGFKVDFETTLDQESLKTNYLPVFYRQQHPDWTEGEIQKKIANLTPEDMDDAVQSGVYDENKEHIRLVVEDIFAKWKNRSNDGKYNALLTTHVGGGKASTPMAMMYFDEFQRVNLELLQNGRAEERLRVAVTFSDSNTHSDTSLATNKGLHRAMQVYNQEFGTEWSMADVAGYSADVVERLQKKSDDGKYLDLVIVVDQLLTGFNAPELNTLYVDRTLKNASLIQAYSRTNRVADMQEKPWGRIVNYRWPAHNEKLMNDALAIYADESAAKLSEEERKRRNQKDGITAKKFQEVLADVQGLVSELRKMTEDFNELPASEKKQEEMYGLLRSYNKGIAKLKQYEPDENGDGFDYSQPEAILEKIGLTVEEEKMLTTVLTNELKAKLAQRKDIPVYQLDLKMSHIKDVKIDYDYLTELIATLLRQVHDKQMEEATETKDKIIQFANGLDNRLEAKQIKIAANAIMDGLYPDEASGLTYPFNIDNSGAIIQAANRVNTNQRLLQFIDKWGLTTIALSEMKMVLEQHQFGKQDLNDTNKISEWQKEAAKTYQIEAADPDIRVLSRVKYRNELRNAIYELADDLVREE